MRRGDLIEWVYERDGVVIAPDEWLWSTLEHRYVSIGSRLVHLLIDLRGDAMTWTNVEGTFRARSSDRVCKTMYDGVDHVRPRKLRTPR